MKKIIVFISLFVIISCGYDEIKCPDKQSKAKICGIVHLNENGKYDYYIKKACKVGETCTLVINPHAYACQNKRGSSYLIKNGKKCNYNEDCLSGHCEGDKCVPNKGCEDCDKEETCVNKNGDMNSHKCRKYLGEGDVIEVTDDYLNTCAPGYYSDDGSGTSKCTKLFSIDNGGDCGSNLVCKSGVCKNDKCVTIETDADCSNGGADCDDLTDRLNGKIVPKYSKKRMEYFKNKVYDRIDKIDFDKLKKKKYNDYTNLPYEFYYKETNKKLFYHNDKKLQEYVGIYNSWNFLFAAGIIDENGKKISDKKCEYEYYMREILASTTLKSSLLYALVILAFLF